MTNIEWASTFRRLERLYVKDGHELEEHTRNEYYDAVKFFPAYQFDRAVDLIRDTHKLKSMPTPAEIRDAISEVMAQTPRATAEELAARCGSCEGDGWTVDDGGERGKRKHAGIARYCDCAVGRKLKAGHISRGMGRRGPVSHERQARQDKPVNWFPHGQGAAQAEDDGYRGDW